MTKRSASSALQLLGRWLPLVAAITGLAWTAALRCLHLANADALLPTLMSTDDLTWFYWGQDRLANLVPLLASPVGSIRWNLALQLWIIGTGWFGLIALASARHQIGSGSRPSPAVIATSTALAGAISIALLPAPMLQVFVFEQLYAFALAIYLVGLVGVTRSGAGPITLGAALVTAATMVNPSLLLYIPVVFVLPGVVVRSAAAARALATAGTSFVLATLASARFGDQSGTGTGYNDFAPGRAWSNFATAMERIAEAVHGGTSAVAITAAIGVLMWRRGTFDTQLRGTYFAAPLFAFGWVALFSGNLWVATNQLSPRYFFPVFATGLLMLTAATTALVQLAAARLTAPRSRVAARASLAAGVAAPLFPLLGVWSFTRIRIDALAAARPAVAEARQEHVDIVTGDYWSVWPTVIEARSQGLDVLGLAYRANPMVDDLSARISGELGGDGAVTVLCLGIGPADCAGSLANWGLSVSALVSEDPLVLDITG